MKKLYFVSLFIFLSSFSAGAVTPKTDATHNYTLPLEEFKERIDQSVIINANNDGKPDYVLLLNPDTATKSESQDLLVFISNGSNYIQTLNLPSYWDSWGKSPGSSSAPELELSGDEKKNLLIVTIRDSYDDSANQILKYRWEKNNFRLIGETKSATPRDIVKTDTGEDLGGRWERLKDINWLTGDMIVECGLKPKLKSGRIKPKYITIAEYDMSADYLEDVCD